MEHLRELPRHYPLKVAKVLPQLEVNAPVLPTEREDLLGHPQVHLVPRQMVLLRIVLQVIQRLLVVLVGGVDDPGRTAGTCEGQVGPVDVLALLIAELAVVNRRPQRCKAQEIYYKADHFGVSDHVGLVL